MKRCFLLLFLLLGCAVANAQTPGQPQINIPFDLDTQARIIPQLCDNAVYSNRRMFADFCAEVVEKLRLAKEKVDKDKAAEAKTQEAK